MRMLGWLTGMVALLSGGVAFAGSAAGASSSEGYEILKKSEAALRRVHRAAYRVEFKGTGWLTRRAGVVSGTAIVGRPSEWGITPFYCEVTVKSRRSDDLVKLTAGCDGNVYFLIDPATRKAHEDMDVSVLGTHGRAVQQVVMEALTADVLVGDELKPEDVVLDGSETVDGVPCHKVRIKSGEPPDVEWLIGMKNFMPRGVRRIYPNRSNRRGRPGTTELMISELKVNPKSPANPFKLVVPEGYTKTDEFAP